MEEYVKRYEEWCTNPYFDAETQAELKAIADNDGEIKERFYKDLEFGTAGLYLILISCSLYSPSRYSQKL